MAIKIIDAMSKTPNQTLDSVVEPLRQTINLKIKADGTVVMKDGSTPGTLNFGNQGEDWATVLLFDLDELYTSGLLKNEVNNSEKLLEYYTVTAHSKKGVEEADIQTFLLKSISQNKIEFKIPKDITEETGVYHILISLTEKTNGLDNVVGVNEQFVTDVFSGMVSGSIYPLLNSREWEYVATQEVVHQTLKKPTIHVDFNENKMPILSVNKLGNKKDKYITNIQIQKLATRNDILYMVFLMSNDVFFGIEADSKQQLWIPEQITKKAGEYVVFIAAYSDMGEEFYSDAFTMIVKDNFLPDDSEYPTGALTDVRGNIIIDSEGRIIILEVGS